MARIKPYSGTSAVRMAQLIRKSQTPVASDRLSFSFQEVKARDESVDGAGNALITFVAIWDGYRFPAVSGSYDRLSLDVVKILPSEERFEIPEFSYPTDTHSVLPFFNEAFGLDLTPDEVTNLPMSARPDKLPIVIKEGNLAWIPGTYLFDLPDLVPANVRVTTDGYYRVTTDGAFRTYIPEA